MIENDFFTVIESLNLGYPIAYTAIDFTPPQNSLWLEVKVFRNSGQDLGIAHNSSKIEEGLFQITVCDRPNKGIINMTTVANGIVAALPRGTVIGDVYIKKQPYLMQIIDMEDRVMLPITMQYST